jgi:hypothetical protein
LDFAHDLECVSQVAVGVWEIRLQIDCVAVRVDGQFDET